MPVSCPANQIIPTVSVVMPCYQAAKYVRAALQSLVSQVSTVAYEIIVVDSSTDGSDRIVEEFPQVRLLHFPYRCQVGTARNIGVEAARGEVVLFVDADTVPVSTWLQQMSAAILSGRADAVGGSMTNGTPWSASGSVGFYLEFFRFVGYYGRPRPARYLVGGNSGFRIDLLRQLRYSDHSLGEDMLVSSRLSRQGNRLLFLPRASVRHLNRTGVNTVLRYQRKLGAAAFFYRSEDSPRWLRVFRAAPELIFLAPFGVTMRIGASLLSRRCVPDFLRFVTLLPFCLMANMVWAMGFREALREPCRHEA